NIIPIKVNYWSDIQWNKALNGSDLRFAYLDYLLNEELLRSNEDLFILNGDIGDSGEFLYNPDAPIDLIRFFIKNYNKIKNLDKKIVINFGNHDDALLSFILKKYTEKKGLKNVIVANEVTEFEIDGKKFLVVPGAHKLAVPGTFTKNFFYKVDNLENGKIITTNFGTFHYIENKDKLEPLETGHYLIREINNEFQEVEKVDKGFLERYVEFQLEKLEDKGKFEELYNKLFIIHSQLLPTKQEIEARLISLKQFYNDFKDSLDDNKKKELELQISQYEQEKNNIENKLNELIDEKVRYYLDYFPKFNEFEFKLAEGWKLYYHVNSKEISKKYEKKDLYGLISHDPIKHPYAKLETLPGIRVKGDNFIYRFLYKDQVYEVNFDIPKGIYSMHEFPLVLIKSISNKLREMRFNEEDINKIILRFDKERFVNYYIKKGKLENEKYDMSDEYLASLFNKVRFHVAGHFENRYKTVDKKGVKKFNKEESDSLYSVVDTMKFPYYIKNPVFTLDDKIKIEYKEADKEKIKEYINNYVYS
ncbi:MAG: metallophosphoesterase, partial [Nanoarchaeota archaeon]